MEEENRQLKEKLAELEVQDVPDSKQATSVRSREKHRVLINPRMVNTPRKEIDGNHLAPTPDNDVIDLIAKVYKDSFQKVRYERRY